MLADDATNEEVEALMTAVKKQLDEPIYIETRNLNSYEQWKGAFEKAGFRYEPHLNFHVHTDRPWEENMSSNRKRQIRHAKGLVVSGLAVSEEEIREWYGVLKELYRKKVKTPLWPEEFFLEAYRQGVGTFIVVKYEGKVIGGTMVVKGLEDERMSGSGGTVYEWFACGKNEEYKEQHPSVMATWAGIQWAKEQGYARYDMMGAGKPDKEYGVRDFKAEFGGELVEHGRFVCIQHPILYTLGTMGVKVLKMLTTNN